MEAFAQFLHMGGYGAYVWSAYAFAGVVLALNILLAQRAERIELTRLAARVATGDDDDPTT